MKFVCGGPYSYIRSIVLGILWFLYPNKSQLARMTLQPHTCTPAVESAYAQQINVSLQLTVH